MKTLVRRKRRSTKFDTMRMMQLLHRNTGQPGTLTASGFGDPEANGSLTEAGTHNGRPYYTLPSGWFVFDGNGFDGWCINPNLNDAEYTVARYVLLPAQPTPVGAYTPITGTAPAGTIN